MFLRGVGTHGSLTMADGNFYEGPVLGVSEDDQFQGHKHRMNYYSPGGSGNVGAYVGPVYSTTDDMMENTVISNGNGTPRAGAETRPVAFGVNYIIKY